MAEEMSWKAFQVIVVRKIYGYNLVDR